LDGAFHHNNPVRIAAQERKLIWPGTAGYPPDILISIGTGYDPTRADPDAQISNDSNRSLREDCSRSQERSTLKKQQTPFIKMLMARLDSMLDCNHIWDEFLANETRPPSNKSYFRFHRFNPILQGDCPKLDEKEKLKKLRDSVKRWLTGQAETQLIKQVARQLVASCFYFDRLNAQKQLGNDKRVQGIRATQPLQTTFYSLS
jgi:hypothetical protein